MRLIPEIALRLNAKIQTPPLVKIVLTVLQTMLDLLMRQLPTKQLQQLQMIPQVRNRQLLTVEKLQPIQQVKLLRRHHRLKRHRRSLMQRKKLL